MKLYLTKQERKQLIENKSIYIVRPYDISAPKNSITFGIGDSYIFDKIDYRWVYGNVDEYIESKKNVGRRATDYKNNTKSSLNGNHWYEFYGLRHNEYDEIGMQITNGKKNLITFIIEHRYIELCPKDKQEYLSVNINMKINLV